jgi:DNA-binding transcriptional MerR regulator
MLKDVEPDLYKRKQLAISILKELEKEKGHNIDAIRKAIEEEGTEGIRRRAKRKRKKERREEREELETTAVEAYS